MRATDRQRDILRLVHAAKTTGQIATELGISRHCAWVYVRRLEKRGLLVRAEGVYSSRYRLTDEGLAALGMRRCCVCGNGTVTVVDVEAMSERRSA